MNKTGSVPGNLRNIRLLISYDGTGFSGWQRQQSCPPEQNRPPGELSRQSCPPVQGGVTGHKSVSSRTVQGVIEAALGKIHKHPVGLTGSGRTDAGVHAAGQVANFYTDIGRMAPERFVPALNSLLPQDVRILAAHEAISDFHARFDARSRTYRYFFIPGRPALAPELRYSHQLWRQPDIPLLNEYARLLLGETDCTVFASPGDPSKSRSRHISQAYFFVLGNKLVFEIRANAFLWKMVRSLTGTLLRYEEQRISPEAFRKIVRSGDRTAAGPTLPPKGLFLWRVDYYRGV